MIQLTDELIKGAFAKTGFDEKYFPLYKEEMIRRYNELQQGDTGEDETSEEERNVTYSICDANVYISYYVREIEKGHSEIWASKFAEELSLDDEDEIFCVFCTYSSIEDEEQREKDLDIYVSSLSSDDIFRERFKSLFHDHDFYPREKAAEYCEIYHRCFNAGKSAIYSHAFANEANNYFDERGTHYNEHFVDIHAEAVEQAIKNGMNDEQAYEFGCFFTDLCDDDSWFISINLFLKKYHEDWQKELYLYLAQKDYKHYSKNDMPELEVEEFKRELYQIKGFDDNDSLPPFDFPDEVGDIRRHKKRSSLREDILDMMFDRDEDFNDDDDGIGGFLSK